MTIGTGTFVPTARFSFPRSFINELVLYRNLDAVTFIGNVFTIYAPPPDPTTATIKILPAFIAWSSNGYTLDYLVTECYYQLTPGGTENPMPFDVVFHVNPTNGHNQLVIGWFGLHADPETFPLESAPSSYWLPPLLP